jgi:hypothetical protein
MVRQSSMSYPGQGRPKDPDLPKRRPTGTGKGRAVRTQTARIHKGGKSERKKSPANGGSVR